MESINPELALVMREALKVSPIDFGIPSTGGKRTAKEQHELFKAGKSKCDGFKNKSYHQSGNAVDVYAYVNGSASWSEKHLSILAGVILSTAIRLKSNRLISIDVHWGGDFTTFTDMPHYETK